MFNKLEEVIEFCEKNHAGVMSAIDGDRPTVRPHHFQMFHEKIFYFVLGANRNSVNYLNENPKLQWMTYSFEEAKGGSIIRIDGEAKFVNEMKVKEMVFNNNYEHLITRFKDGPTSPKFLVYEVTNAKVSALMPGNPEPYKVFEL